MCDWFGMGMRVTGRRQRVQVVRGHGLVLIDMRRHIGPGWLQRAHRPESVHPTSKRGAAAAGRHP